MTVTTSSEPVTTPSDPPPPRWVGAVDGVVAGLVTVGLGTLVAARAGPVWVEALEAGRRDARVPAEPQREVI